MDKVIKSYIKHICGEDSLEENVPMSTRTTFKIGGPAKFFVTVKSKEQLIKLISSLSFASVPYCVVGGGSNLLVSDEGYDGVIIKPAFNEVIQNDNFIYADAGATLAKVVNFATSCGLSGLEFACGIPGTIGGAVYMNAGAYGSEISDIVTMVDVWDGNKIKSINNKELDFGYRNSIFKKEKDLVILGVYLYLRKSDKQQISTYVRELLLKRINTQPKEPSAGSIFKKPSPDFYVGKAIEELDLKGSVIGGAQISNKHAGFIINVNNASSADVLNLINLVKEKVLHSYGVELELEVILI